MNVFDLDTSVIPEGENIPLRSCLENNGYNPIMIMVRVDGEIVPTADMMETMINSTRNIRVYSLVGGG